MAKKTTGIKKKNLNRHILNVITPSGIDYDNVSANLGDNYGKAYYISKYPTEGGDYGWLAPLCNLEGTTTVVEYRYTDPSNIINVFNKRISELKVDRDLAKEESEKVTLDKKIDDLSKMIKKISVASEPVGYVNIILHVQDNDAKAYNNRLKRVMSIVRLNGCNMRLLKYKQLQALEVIAPYGIPNRLVSNMGDRNMPISSFIGGYPMANPGINDSGGYYIGKARDNKLVILNMWLRGGDRTNSNWFITGIPGVGKSTFIKLIYLLELAFGAKIIVFDPEQEYQDLARDPDVNGDIIDTAGGTTGRINPLQIRKSPRVTQEDLAPGESISDYFEYDDENGLSDMALHIQNLRVFFKLYFGSEEFTSGIKTALEQCLIETYNRFGINWDADISKLKNTDFPIIKDLYETVEKHSLDPELSAYRKGIYDKLLDLLYSCAKGADQFIWNGYTTIDPKSSFIVLNASKLLDLDENVKRAQFFNLTMWGWQQMAIDRTSKVIFGLDEGYLFVDPEYPDMMKFLRNISKRDRKYEGALMFITHAVVDVLDPVVKRFGQAIIDNACYKFIMGTDGKNLEETIKLFNLKEREINILAAKSRGKGILFAGSMRMDVSIDVRESFLKRFGKAGGR